MKNRILSITIALLVLNPLATRAQIRTAYSTRPLDSKAERLPGNYRGMDPEVIYQTLKRLETLERKGEFETTDQHNSRISKMREMPILGILRRDGIFAFTIDGLKTSYNADAHELEALVRLGAVWNNVSPDPGLRALSLKSKVSRRKYVAQNAMGAKVLVDELATESFEVAIGNFRQFKPVELDRRQFFIKITIQADVAEAKQMKERLRALVICRLLSPYIGYGALLDEATFGKSSQYFLRMYYLKAEVAELWLYDRMTGEIYKKIPSEERSKN